MNVASQELCKTLYDLSGWELDEEGLFIEKWFWTLGGKLYDRPVEVYKLLQEQRAFPAYDLGYLFRMLPISRGRRNGFTSTAIVGLQLILKGAATKERDYWEASYWKTGSYAWADTPEDALAKLAIELFKRGILQRASS